MNLAMVQDYFNQNEPFKVVLLGESGIGKSSIIEKICSRDHITSLESYNIEYGSKIISTNNPGNIHLNVHFYNLIDSEKTNIFKYQDIKNFFYKDASLIIIVFDLTKINYVETITRWIAEVEKHRKILNKGFKILCLGTKADLRPKDFKTQYSELLGIEIADLSKKFNQQIFYYEVSAQDCNSCINLLNQIGLFAENFHQTTSYL